MWACLVSQHGKFSIQQISFYWSSQVLSVYIQETVFRYSLLCSDIFGTVYFSVLVQHHATVLWSKKLVGAWLVFCISTDKALIKKNNIYIYIYIYSSLYIFWNIRKSTTWHEWNPICFVNACYWSHFWTINCPVVSLFIYLFIYFRPF